MTPNHGFAPWQTTTFKFVADGEHRSAYQILIGGKNFGCGSSREHAPAALQIAGVTAVVAESYARIFYRNAVDGGFLLPFESEQPLMNETHTGDDLEINVPSGTLKNLTRDTSYRLQPLGDVDHAMGEEPAIANDDRVTWFEQIDQRGLHPAATGRRQSKRRAVGRLEDLPQQRSSFLHDAEVVRVLVAHQRRGCGARRRASPCRVPDDGDVGRRRHALVGAQLSS